MEIGYLSKLENPDTLRAIVQRLPSGLRKRWRDVADNITETVGHVSWTLAITSPPRPEQHLMPYLETFPANLRQLTGVLGVNKDLHRVIGHPLLHM